MIDLRSDTVTKPGPAMRAAMAAAEVGDDVYGEDPTVNRLEERVAELLGKEAGLLAASGTQANLCGLLAHCGRGDEYIVGHQAHTYMYEGGGAAVLGSIQPQPVPTGDDGMLDLGAAEAAIKPDDSHFARTRLLCLENTIDGKVLTLDQMNASAGLAARHGLSHHLDGARLWNAAVALGVAPAVVAAPFDTVSVCLSKGLGTPVGSVLVGSADVVAAARRWRKLLGGGMRQAGVLAAAGLYAVEHHIDRLADDHDNAARLAAGLDALDGVKVDSCSTNMVFVQLVGTAAEAPSVEVSGPDSPGADQATVSDSPGDHAAGSRPGPSETTGGGFSGRRPQGRDELQEVQTRPDADGRPSLPAYVSGRPKIQEELRARGIATLWNGNRARLVTHLDVSADDVDTALDAFAKVVR